MASMPFGGLVHAHTPYRQWKVMRQRFLLVHSSRTDSVSDEVAETLVAILQNVLPQAHAMVARARDEQRIASLLTTGQAMLAVLHGDVARELYAGGGEFGQYEGAQLRTLLAIGEYRLVTVAAFPVHHAWLGTSALVEYGTDAGVQAIKPDIFNGMRKYSTRSILIEADIGKTE